ncbi:helix-turn-helix domain-containing protein [Actinomadura fibrosa]|uniref:Helix-turn-helix domain-containing protein n=1 Tax=Actinomadura fibrosa TaxID=111802 RepID=A0ABW2XKS3_9ACTN|nr:helix-turn-helix transcriptional regulator [Actinomadura fibrosa]
MEKVLAEQPSSAVGQVVRTARVARGWTQRQLADRLHCSPSTVSRLETGVRQAVDVSTLRRVAAALRVAPEELGIAATVAGGIQVGDDVRRRQLLSSLAVTAAAAAVPVRPVGAAEGLHLPSVLLVGRLRDAMLGTGPVGTVPPPAGMRAALVRAVKDYDACRYDRLADTLPGVIGAGHALGEVGAVTLAEAYNLVTRIMIKLGDERLGWVAADRARALAETTGAALAAGEAARNLAVLARRAGWHDQAAQVAVSAAEDEMLHGDDPGRSAERGLLVMSAAYTAAHAGDRAGMRELTRQAAAIAAGLGERVLLREHGGGFGPAAVQLHLISAEYTAGDPAAAVAAARALSPRSLPTVERQARYYTDLARAYGMWERRDQCLQALLAAERIAPDETRARPAVREMVSQLLVSGRTSAQLRGLAARCRIR